MPRRCRGSYERRAGTQWRIRSPHPPSSTPPSSNPLNTEPPRRQIARTPPRPSPDRLLVPRSPRRRASRHWQPRRVARDTAGQHHPRPPGRMAHGRLSRHPTEPGHRSLNSDPGPRLTPADAPCARPPSAASSPLWCSAAWWTGWHAPADPGSTANQPRPPADASQRSAAARPEAALGNDALLCRSPHCPTRQRHHAIDIVAAKSRMLPAHCKDHAEVTTSVGAQCTQLNGCRIGT